MFQRFIRFCRRILKSKGFRVGFRIFSWLVGVYCVYNFVMFLVILNYTGISFDEFVNDLLFFKSGGQGYYISPAAVLIGIVIGLRWVFRRVKNRKDQEDEEEEEEEEEKEKPVETPASAQEEEFPEPPRYMSQG